MKVLSLFATGITAAGLSAASPIQKRDVGGVLMCVGANATGECNYQVYEMETCYDLPSPFYQNTSTFAVDGEAFTCWPRTGSCADICTSPTGCSEGAMSFSYEYKYDLGAIGWNTIIGSFDCALNITSSSS